MKLAQARARGLLWHRRKGGRYGERLVSLTPPHREHDSVRGRIELVLAAWKYLLKSLNAWARAEGVELEFVRVLEWTLGSDSRGHPHLHVWVFSTFLPQHLLSAWWRSALERAGLQLGDQEELLAVDIRMCRGDDGAAQELVKYMCKDIGADGQYVDPAVFADVYAALDGNRAAQGSRGFLGLGDAVPSCRHCGATYSLRVRIVPNDAERMARSREDLDAVDRTRGPPTPWQEQLETSAALRLQGAEASTDGLPRARECAVCTATGRDAGLKRRSIDGRAFTILCSACRSTLGPRHMTLKRLESEILDQLRTTGP